MSWVPEMAKHDVLDVYKFVYCKITRRSMLRLKEQEICIFENFFSPYLTIATASPTETNKQATSSLKLVN